jgi:Zn-dependent alcohol dehydrogenase
MVDSAVMAAKVASCAQIIAVDINQSKLDFAKKLGATHTILLAPGDEPAAIAKVQINTHFKCVFVSTL